MASAKVEYQISGSSAGSFVRTAPPAQDLDGAGDKIGAMFIAPDASQAITKIGVYCTALTGTSPTYSVRIEGSDVDGLPDGTDSGGGSPTKATFQAVAAFYHEITLSNPFTPTAGEAYAVVLEYDSGTIDVSNFATFVRNGEYTITTRNLPYTLFDVGGGWTKVNEPSAVSPIYLNGFIVQGTEIQIGGAQLTFSNTSSPDERGALWTPKDDCTLIGLFIPDIRISVAAANLDFVIYSGAFDSSVAQKTVSIQGDELGGTSFGSAFVYFEGLSISQGTEYRLIMKPVTANSISTGQSTFVNSAHRESVFGPLQETGRTDGGNFSDTAEKLIGVFPLISEVAAGGGGGDPGPVRGPWEQGPWR